MRVLAALLASELEPVDSLMDPAPDWASPVLITTLPEAATSSEEAVETTIDPLEAATDTELSPLRTALPPTPVESELPAPSTTEPPTSPAPAVTLTLPPATLPSPDTAVISPAVLSVEEPEETRITPLSSWVLSPVLRKTAPEATVEGAVEIAADPEEPEPLMPPRSTASPPLPVAAIPPLI